MTAVLLSGGLDSAVLLAEEAARGEVQPIYVSVGLAWEAAERAMVGALLESAALRGRVAAAGRALGGHERRVPGHALGASRARRRPITRRTRTCTCPAATSSCSRKAGVYCAAAGIDRIVLGTLGHNPFPDATPEFRAAMAQALSLGLAHRPRDRGAVRADRARPRSSGAARRSACRSS